MKQIVCFLLSALMVCSFSGCGAPATQPSKLKKEEAATLVEANGASYYISEHSILQAGKETALVTVKDDESLGCLQIDGKYLYYAVFLNAAGTAFEVHRMPLNGGADTVVLDHTVFPGEHALHSFTADGNHLYLGMNFAFFSYDLTTDIPLLLTEDAAVYEIHDSMLYFIDHAARTFTVYKLPLSGGDAEIVLGSGISEPTDTPLYKNLLFIGDTLYVFKRYPDGVTGRDGIYTYADGAETCVIEDESVNEVSLATWDGKLYYVRGHFNTNTVPTALCCYDPATGNTAEIRTVPDFNLFTCVRDGWYYYEDTAGDLQRVEI